MSEKRSSFRKSLPLITALTLILPLLFALAVPVSAATLCVKPGGAGGCYASIQAAVDAAGDGDTIYVYPGNYPEGVNLTLVAGDITLITVNNAGNPTPGTVTVDNPGPAPEFSNTGSPDVNVTIDGFKLRSLYSAIDLHVDDGDVEIRNVDASGTGEGGIKVSAGAGNVTITDCTANDNEGHGILTRNVGANLTIRDCTANRNDDEGFDVSTVDGEMTITGCTANGNDDGGIQVDDVDGKVTITGCITNGDTDDEGIVVADTGGDVTIRDCTANDNSEGGIEVYRTGGKVTISNCTANGNGDDGVYVQPMDLETPSASDEDDELEVDVEVAQGDDPDDVERQGVTPSANGGNVTITNCTANGNDESGFDPEAVEGTVTIKACVARDNEFGVDLDGLGDADAVLVSGSIICGNECGLGLWSSIPSLNAEGNWWGCPGGPADPACDPICQDDSVAVDYTPWIDTVTATGPAAVMAGSSAVVTFQFSDSAKTVFLGEGPGDLHGDPTFMVSSDNGTVIDPGFINEPHGVLAATLIPAFGGTATVTVDGPCGLDAFITLDTWEFVPEPGSVVLLASGLMGLAGYATLRWRSRQ